MLNDTVPTKTTTTSNDLTEVYQFFSNRNLVQFPKSIYTINNDITEEFGISSNILISGYLAMKHHFLKLTQDVCFNEIQEIYKNSLQFKIYMQNIMSNQISDYAKLSNMPPIVLKNLYRIIAPNYIFTFINDHKNILPAYAIDKILPLITNITYVKNSYRLNNYIKRSIAMKILLDIDRNNFKDYYNYSRFKYLYDKLSEVKLTPKAYNINAGALYFTISYSKSSKKEQIFDIMRNNCNNRDINIDDVKLYINTDIGEISSIRKLFDNRWKKFRTEISDSIYYKVPNIIRMILHELLYKFSKKEYKCSYKKMLNKIIYNNIIVENYCEKVDYEGQLLKVPMNNEWRLLSSKEVRKLTINDIDIKFMLDSYEYIIKPILQVIIMLKK